MTAGEVPIELHTLPWFGSELQLDELFDRLWAFVSSFIMRIYIEFVVQACLVNRQGSNWRPFIRAHDLSGTIRCGVRFGRFPGGRIRCHLQAFCAALSCLLLIGLDNHDLSRQGGELYL